MKSTENLEKLIMICEEILEAGSDCNKVSDHLCDVCAGQVLPSRSGLKYIIDDAKEELKQI